VHEGDFDSRCGELREAVDDRALERLLQFVVAEPIVEEVAEDVERRR
jgi:hypothetical protein